MTLPKIPASFSKVREISSFLPMCKILFVLLLVLLLFVYMPNKIFLQTNTFFSTLHNSGCYIWTSGFSPLYIFFCVAPCRCNRPFRLFPLQVETRHYNPKHSKIQCIINIKLHNANDNSLFYSIKDKNDLLLWKSLLKLQEIPKLRFFKRGLFKTLCHRLTE